MDNWRYVRRLARQVRAEAEAAKVHSLRGEDLVQAAAHTNNLTLVLLPPNDPMLGGARSMLDTSIGMIAVDDDLPPGARLFSIAHEIGHQSLHGGVCRCDAADIDEAPTTTPLPFAEGAIETYNPRQRRETEANVFAAEFLIPSNELQRLFVEKEQSCSQLAAFFGVSETAILNQMATVLLTSADRSSATEPVDQRMPPLDETQARACQVPHGPVLIDAGPGTGKTLTLVRRLLHLLQDRQVRPENILALTFSNKAAAEMHLRLARVAPEQAQAVTICTFHAFCLDLLRRYGSHAGLPTELRVLDPVDAAVLLEQDLQDLGLVEYMNLAVPNLYLSQILGAISRAKDELVGPEGYAQLAQKMAENAGEDQDRLRVAARATEVARVYHHYQHRLEGEGLVDFGDLIFSAVALLRDNPAVMDSLRQQYRHILVDEYQDVNRASAILLKLLADDGHGLWAVGDLRQAIYRFRGASPVNIGRFEEDYPQGYRLNLGYNYRSTPPLVALFRHAAGMMPLDNLPAPDWESSRAAEEELPVTVAIASDDQAEIDGIAATIGEKLENGWRYNQQAILCRTNAQAATLATGLEARGIPVGYLGSLFARSEVKDMLALLSLACEGDGSGLVRVGQMAEHAMDPQDVQQILSHARATEQRFPDLLEKASEIDGLSSDGVHSAMRLARLITPMAFGTDAWLFLARYFFEHSSYIRDPLRALTGAGRQRLMAVGQLLELARDFGELPLADPDEDRKRAFLNYVRRLIASQDPRIYQPLTAEHIDAVRILTVHASKGLEFPVVFLPNLAQRRFPPQKRTSSAPPPPGLTALADEDPLVEEACLFFVALSRARDELVLSRAERYGRQKYKPSPLLDMVQGYFAATPPVELRWAPEDETEAVVSAPTSAPEAANEGVELKIGDIERYWRCPRQYYYTRVLGLQEPEQRLGYRRLHSCVYRTAAWLRDRHSQDELPSDWGQVAEHLEKEWEDRGPVDHSHEALYKETAQQMLRRLWQNLIDTPRAGEPWAHEVTVELNQFRVQVRIDHAEIGEDSSLRLVRYRSGRTREEDRKMPRLALYREAARQLEPERECRIELQYLGEGTSVDVPDQGRWEQRRLDKIAAAAQSITAGELPPHPQNRSLCTRCSFFFVCPGPQA
jgi:superfamily I DNA/RNA helicase/Zn-dependent peptidase ImmA (M78 family)